MLRLVFSSILGMIFMLPVARAETVCVFNGAIDFVNRELQLQVDFPPKQRISGSLKLSGDIASLDFQVEHLKINAADLTTNLEGSFYLKRDTGGRVKDIKGFVWSRYTLFNYKPSREMVAAFGIRDGKLNLEKLTWEGIVLNGALGFVPPYDLDVYCEITEMDINELAAFLKVDRENLFLAGLVRGKIRFSGQPRRLKLKGSLYSDSGEMQGFVYRDCLINFSGYYPVLNIDESSISDEEGLIYSLGGRFNLREINNFISSEHNITVSPFSERDMDLRTLAIRKREEVGKDAEVEFSYRLKQKRPTDNLSGNDEGILGIEHRYKF